MRPTGAGSPAAGPGLFAGVPGSTAAGPGTGEGVVRILRFDPVQRAAHWVEALLFGVCILTALPLYFSGVERLVGRHTLMVQIHVWAGVALPVPLLVSFLGSWGRRMRRDLRRFNRWTRDEVRWLLWLGRRGGPVVDKFNPGQKLNAVFTGGAIVVLLGTGAIMHWFGPFPVPWRTGATFVHEALAWAVVVVLAGHVLMALTHPAALRSMTRGWVSASWARAHAPAWAAEELPAPPAPTTRPGRPGPGPCGPP